MRSYSLRILFFASTALAACNNSCKAFPGTSSWPSKQAWGQLNDTLEGRLIKPLSPAGVCHEGQPNYNEEQCAKVQESWPKYQFHANDPVSVMWEVWTNNTCLPDPEKSCSGDGYPAYVVNATSVDDVKAGVDFARQNNIRLVVKSSGHDFVGRSIAPGSLSIWMRHMNKVEYHEDRFQLTNSNTVIDGDAMSCGGGTDMYSLIARADKHGMAIVGGGAKTVSVGGYLSGGGHGMLSPEFGLAVDNVLEIEVVTPKGDFLVVNEDNHPDLFWALRGGGGSTFGVVTSYTLKTHPSPSFQSVSIIAATEPDNPMADDFIAFIASRVPSLLEQGFRGYGILAINGSLPLPIPGLRDRWTGLGGGFNMVNKESGAMAALIDDLNATVSEKFNGTALVYNEPIQEFPTFLDFYNVKFDSSSAGAGPIMVSRLIDEETLTGDPDALVEALKAATSTTGLMSFYPLAGEGVHNAKPRGGSNSVNPGWRKAIVHAYASSRADGTPGSYAKVTEELDDSFELLRRLTPELGAYMNEGAGFEKDPGKTFWGENYDRLLSIKREVDPQDVFWCNPCVGNDRWVQRNDGRLCRIDGASRL